MQKYSRYIIKALPALVILVLMIFPGCSSSNPPQPANELTPGNAANDYSMLMPPYTNPANWESVPRYTVQELKAKMDSKSKLLLVDCRYPEQFQIDHIQGAVNAWVSDVVEGKWTPTGSPNDEVIIYWDWDGESDSAEAALYLIMYKGYTNVSVLYGGLKAWVDAGYPVYKNPTLSK